MGLEELRMFLCPIVLEFSVYFISWVSVLFVFQSFTMQPSLGTLHADKAGLTLTQTCLPLPPQCWGHRQVSPQEGVCFVLLGKVLLHSPDWPGTWDNSPASFS